MPEFDLAIITSSLIAGVFTFFAPCTLPLVPAFLGIISGTRLEEMKNPELAKTVRRRIFKNAVFYVLGFSLVFILFGVSLTFVSHVLGFKDWLQRIGGVIIIVFGLFMLGWPGSESLSNFFQKIDLAKPLKLLLSGWLNLKSVSLLNSFLLGALFAVGWSPCVGPLLGSVLLLASTSGTVLEGTFLLVVFSIGLGLPFLIVAMFAGKALTVFGKWGRTLEVINKIAGGFLMFLGFLLMAGWFSHFHNQLLIYFYKFPFFEVFVNKFL